MSEVKPTATAKNTLEAFIELLFEDFLFSLV